MFSLYEALLGSRKIDELFSNWLNLLISECTFLILDRALYEKTKNEIGKLSCVLVLSATLSKKLFLFADALIGDTNLFLNQDYFLPETENEELKEDVNNEIILAEAEIMIAEPNSRGKGYGKQAILLMLKYGQSELKVQEFVSKIGYENATSQNMFKKLLFVEQSRSDVFQEITFKRSVDVNWIEWLNNEVKVYEIDQYES